MKPAIEIRNLGKQYKLTSTEPYIALRDVITQGVKNIFSGGKKTTEKFWALQDINLDIMPGERVGIIGRNGAGKSTLLKIISRITPPTTGEAIIRGRVGSLLEVGTGFHPELTGRENIYLNGSILGLKRSEINNHLDEIIDFSGVEKFIDTPLKRYSSGMQMRLAFSVAAHLQSEILLIDEVLAVGDMEFQKKCIGKMEEVSKSEGRTILFVSHNIKAVNDFCQKGILLDKGMILSQEKISIVTELYINSTERKNNFRDIENIKKKIYFTSIITTNLKKEHKYVFKKGEEIAIEIELHNIDWPYEFIIGLGLNCVSKGRVLIDQKNFTKTDNGSIKKVFIQLPSDILTPNNYTVDISIMDINNDVLDILTDAISFEIANANTKFETISYDYGIIDKELTWEDYN